MSEVKPLLSAGMGINMSYDGQAETAYPLPPTIEAKIGGSFNVGPLALDLNVGLNGVSYVDLFGTVQGVLGPKSRNWDVGGLAGVDVNNDHDPIFGGLFQVALSQGDNTRLALQGEVSHQPIDSITRGGISLVIDTTAL